MNVKLNDNFFGGNLKATPIFYELVFLFICKEKQQDQTKFMHDIITLTIKKIVRMNE